MGRRPPLPRPEVLGRARLTLLPTKAEEVSTKTTRRTKALSA
jgi:hypothetical protein